MTLPTAADVVKVQLQHAWSHSRRVLDGVTEDDYFWEPASPCWSVRRRESSIRGWGAGEFVCEDAWPPPDPLPTTTIVTMMLTEHVHHIAEIGVLCDLRRGHAASQLPPESIADPDWWSGNTDQHHH